MIKLFFTTLVIVFANVISFSQTWSLKLNSKVELRNWKLTTKASVSEKVLEGALITLYKDKEVIGQTNSDLSGNFTINIPNNGEFILSITYAGCNEKKFSVSTKGVPDDVGKGNFIPSVRIGGFMMSRPLKGVDYIGLLAPLVKVEYKGDGKSFDRDEVVTNKGQEIVSSIYDAENTIIQKFCGYNKQGDDALAMKNCPVAKTYYEKAIGLLPDESYPKTQLMKAEECIKIKEAAADAAKLEAQRKEGAAKKANEKTIAEKKTKEKEAFNKSAPTNTSTAISNTVTTENPDEKENNSSDRKGESKHKTRKVLSADGYKNEVAKGNSLFNDKRFKEAKTAFEEALKSKPNDPYALEKIAECNKALSPK